MIKLHSQPLKDIAAVSGQSARFECIVQCDPHPNNVFWTKNGQVVENGPRYQIEFRNGVCRLFIPQSYPGAKNSIFNCKHFLIKNISRWCRNVWMRCPEPHRCWCNASRVDGPRRQAWIQNLLITFQRIFIHSNKTKKCFIFQPNSYERILIMEPLSNIYYANRQDLTWDCNSLQKIWNGYAQTLIWCFK